MNFLDILMRWMHIFPAVTLLGAALFMRLAVLPATQSLPSDHCDALKGSIRSRWQKVVRACITMLLVSGIVNFVIILQRYDVVRPLYHMLFGIKFILALGVFFLAEMLHGKSGLAQKLRQNTPFWLNILLALAITLVAISGVLKVSPHTPKAAASASP